MGSTKRAVGGQTSVPYMWALVLRGGAKPGCRPFTRMAYLTHAVAEGEGRSSLRGFIGNCDLRGWTNSTRKVQWKDIVRSWCTCPSDQQIKRAKKAIKEVTS